MLHSPINFCFESFLVEWVPDCFLTICVQRRNIRRWNGTLKSKPNWEYTWTTMCKILWRMSHLLMMSQPHDIHIVRNYRLHSKVTEKKWNSKVNINDHHHLSTVIITIIITIIVNTTTIKSKQQQKLTPSPKNIETMTIKEAINVHCTSRSWSMVVNMSYMYIMTKGKYREATWNWCWSFSRLTYSLVQALQITNQVTRYHLGWWDGLPWRQLGRRLKLHSLFRMIMVLTVCWLLTSTCWQRQGQVEWWL